MEMKTDSVRGYCDIGREGLKSAAFVRCFASMKMKWRDQQIFPSPPAPPPKQLDALSDGKEGRKSSKMNVLERKIFYTW